MKVAIMQPYFLPYLGYWHLFEEADLFVMFDLVVFKKRSWMPRNRVLHPDPNQEFNYIKIPCKPLGDGLISSVEVLADQTWFDSIIGLLSVYKRMRAPNYDAVTDLLRVSISDKPQGFVDVIESQFLRVLDYLGVECPLIKATDIDINVDAIQHPGDWALEICRSLQASHYVNPCGGASIFDEKKYLANGVSIEFLKPSLTPYKQGLRDSFVPGLSIVDILMFCEAHDITQRIKTDYSLLSQKQLLAI